MIPPLKFTYEESLIAGEQWGLNCGPAAIAAICGLSLDALRPHLGDFDRKRYTNPTLMYEILKSLGIRYTLSLGRPGTVQWPNYGLARIQWEGPWTGAGVPIRARYRHTHWVGCCAQNRAAIGIFDVNCLNNGTGWVSLNDWGQITAPFLSACHPHANGKWHLTHSIEIKVVR